MSFSNTGIIQGKQILESVPDDVVIKHFTSQYTPTQNQKNSTVTFAEVTNLVIGQSYVFSCTVQWDFTAATSISNWGSLLQGDTYNNSSWNWNQANALVVATKNYYCNETFIKTNPIWNKHFSIQFIAAQTGVRIGWRTDYSDGTSWVKMTDIEVVPEKYFVGKTENNTSSSIGAKILVRDDIADNLSSNILSQSYTKDNPFSFSSSAKDGIAITSQRASVTPGSTYYFTAKSDCVWSIDHGGDDARTNHKVTIWLYLSENWTSYSNYDTPIVFCYQDSRWIKDNLWKITIPSDRNWASVRVNQYSDGTNVISAKFWDIALIPESSFTPPNSDIVSREIVEY